jgi:hypothetical protein
LLPPVTVLDPDEAERDGIERRLATGAARNRVFGAGVEAELRRGPAHRLTMRSGALALSNAAGQHQVAPSFETSYGYTARTVTANLRWRNLPASMPGVSIGGDETWFDGSVRLADDVWLVSQAFRSLFEVSGQETASASHGTSIGARYQHRAYRVEARANYRESLLGAASIRRSGALYAGLPLGSVSVNAGAELGETDGARGVHPLRYYNASLRWSGDTGFATVTIGRNQSSGLPAQERLDVLGSVKRGLYELSGGAWITRGYVAGGHPGVWSSVGVPILLDLTAVAGVEYTPLDWTAPSQWRGSLTVRRPLTLSLDFLKPGSAR